MLGIAIRTGSPLSLSLAEPVWKQLAGMSLTIADLSEVTGQGGVVRAVWGTLRVLSQSWAMRLLVQASVLPGLTRLSVFVVL